MKISRLIFSLALVSWTIGILFIFITKPIEWWGGYWNFHSVIFGIIGLFFTIFGIIIEDKETTDKLGYMNSGDKG